MQVTCRDTTSYQEITGTTASIHPQKKTGKVAALSKF